MRTAVQATTEPPPQLVLTPAQVADWLEMTVAEVTNLTSRRLLPQPLRFGRTRRYRRADLVAWFSPDFERRRCTQCDQDVRVDLFRQRSHRCEPCCAASRAAHRAYLDSINAHKRRAMRLRKNGGSATPEQVRARVAYFGGLCWICAAPSEAIDHVIPVARGGTGWPANLRPICTSCNSKKGAGSWPALRKVRRTLP